MTWEFFHRPIGGSARRVQTVAGEDAARDEIRSWGATSLTHGDVVVSVGPDRSQVYVADARGRLLLAPTATRETVLDWDEQTRLYAKFRDALRCGVTRRLLIRAGAAVAREYLRERRDGGDTDAEYRLKHLDTALAYFEGVASLEDVRKAQGFENRLGGGYVAHLIEACMGTVWSEFTEYPTDVLELHGDTFDRKGWSKGVEVFSKHIPYGVLACALAGVSTPEEFDP